MADNLNDNIGKPKLKVRRAVAPNPAFRVKTASLVSDEFRQAFEQYMEKSSGMGTPPPPVQQPQQQQGMSAGQTAALGAGLGAAGMGTVGALGAVSRGKALDSLQAGGSALAKSAPTMSRGLAAVHSADVARTKNIGRAVGGGLKGAIGGLAIGGLAGLVGSKLKDSGVLGDGLLGGSQPQPVKTAMSLGSGAKPWDKMTDEEKKTRRTGSATKTAFAKSQYSGPGGGGSPKYTSVIPPFSSPPVKTGGPPSEETDGEKTAAKPGYEESETAKRNKARTYGTAAGGLTGALGGIGTAAYGAHKAFPHMEKRIGPAAALLLSAGAGASSGLAGGYAGGKAGKAIANEIIGLPPSKRKKSETSKESMVSMRDELEKLNNVQDPQAQLSKHQGIGIPKTTAPPGPSIQQVAKPVGFGKPIAGSTKSGGV